MTGVGAHRPELFTVDNLSSMTINRVENGWTITHIYGERNEPNGIFPRFFIAETPQQVLLNVGTAMSLAKDDVDKILGQLEGPHGQA